MNEFLQAILLGVVEGLTEFIPVSSTGHLILLVDLLGFAGPPGKVFEIVIQFGAILAICWLYRLKLWETAHGAWREMCTSLRGRDIFSYPHFRFLLILFLAFLPAAIIGLFAHDFIKTVLFSPGVVSVMLIIGGIAILLIERFRPAPRIPSVEAITPRLALMIGLAQSLAMISGTSRSGATIMGALLFGLERKAAAEFSFFLAIPTMFAAACYDLYKNAGLLSPDDLGLIATGFISAFIAALLVVRWFVAFISRHGFGLFAWYRIALGAGMLLLLHG